MGVGANQQVSAKQLFNIDVAMHCVLDAVQPLPKAALFELADAGFRSAFEQLVACMISVRTRDETTLLVARRLFEQVRTPAAVSQLTLAEIEQLISGCTFYEAKARQIHTIARRVMSEHQGILPCDSNTLRSFTGVGPKCANLVLGIACNQPCISVDVHVHRITNRWGYVHTRTPEQTMGALEIQLPVDYWIEINRLLVPFGKHICTGTLPRCSICPVQNICQQIGVQSYR